MVKRLILLMALLSLFMLFSVSAFTATINVPAQGGTISNNTKLNVSVSAFGTDPSISCAITASSPTTANSSSSFIGNFSNATAQTESVNASFTTPIIILEDSNDYTFAATCYNSTGQASATSITGVSVDRTVPTIATTAHVAGLEFEDKGVITYAITGDVTSSCRIAFDRTSFSGSNTFAMVHSANTCTYTVSKATIADGIYKTYVRASDGTNTTISAGRDFKIKTLEGVAEDPVSALSVPAVQKVVSDKLNFTNIIVIVIIGGMVWMAFFRKKK